MTPHHPAVLTMLLLTSLTSQATADPCGVWYPVATGTAPSARYAAETVYDAAAGRVLLFGGHISIPNADVYYNDVWQYSGGTWAPLAAVGTPPPLAPARVILDPVRNRLLVVTSTLGVYALALSGVPTWSVLVTAGPPPPELAPILYDPARDRLLLIDAQLWSLSLSGPTPTWTATGVASPPGVPGGIRPIYDSTRDRIVALLTNYGFIGPGRLWALPLAGNAWGEVASANGLPQYRASGEAVYDPVCDRMLGFGGDTPGPPYPQSLGDTWSITFHDGVAAVDLTPVVGSFGAREGAALVYDSAHRELVVFGGATFAQNTQPVFYSDTHHVPLGIHADVAIAPQVLDLDFHPITIGSVSRSPQTSCDVPGSAVTYTATPATGYTFTGWSGSVQSTSNPLVVSASGCATILANFAPVSNAQQTGHYLNLAWDDCGVHGSGNRTFACDANTGPPFVLVGSFSPPAGSAAVNAISATLYVRSAGPIPDWWKFGSGACRGSALSTDFDFTASPTSCEDPWHGLAGGGFAYDVAFSSSNRARLRIQAAIPQQNAAPMDSSREYAAFKVRIARTATIGAGSCAGCASIVTIQLDNLELFGGFSSLGVLRGARDRDYARWQSNTAGVESFAGFALKLSAVRWDPDGRGADVDLTLPRHGAAALELFDVSGRRLATRVLDAAAAGVQRARLTPDRPLGSGVYFVRLRQGTDRAQLETRLTR